MAELGTFAAALQIAETVVKLKRAWGEIRDGPRELGDILEEVLLQADLLGTLQPRASETSTGANDQCWRRCHDLFRRSVDSLQALTGELGSSVQRHRVTGSLRLYMRKSDLRRCMERLQRAQTIMSLAQHAYAISLVLQEIYSLRQMPHRVLSRQLPSILHPDHSVDTGRSSMTPSTMVPCKKKAIKKNGRNPSKTVHRNVLRGNSTSKPIFSFQLPLWTVKKSIDILMVRNNQTFGITIRAYNVRSNDSKLFRAARNSEWDLVRSMLMHGEGSPFDQDEWGKILLHYAALDARPNVCRFLLEHGPDASYRSWSDRQTPLVALAVAYRPGYVKQLDSHSSSETARLLLASDYEASFDEVSESKSWAWRCSLPPHVLAILTSGVSFGYEGIDPSTRARAALSTTSLDAKSVAVLLGYDLTLEDAFNLVRTTSGHSYAHRRILFNISTCLACLSPEDKRRDGWLEVLSSIIKFESENMTSALFRSLYAHYIALSLQTTKARHILSRGELRNEAWTSIGKTWLQALVSCGADLRRYGKAEKLFLKNGPEAIVGKDGRGRYHCHRVKFLITGPDVDDWRLFVEPSIHVYDQILRPGSSRRVVQGHTEYEMAGDFWTMIESPELYGMPGTYLDDEQVVLNNGRPVKVKGPIF